MITNNLHRQPVQLDSVQHRELKLDVPVTDWGVASKLNMILAVAAEFGDVCREFPIVFIKAGKEPDGTDAIAPIAVFGLVQEDNLFVEKGRWRGQYIPTIVQTYPFGLARISEERFAICVDMDYEGIGKAAGRPVFDAHGQPTEMLEAMRKHLENLEGEIQRTRLIGRRLQELGLLQEMRFDATLPDGRKQVLEGFMTVDDKKVTELSDALVTELHRNGILGLIHLHWVSLGNMRRLAEWHAERTAAPPAAA